MFKNTWSKKIIRSYQIDDMSGFQTGIAGKEVKNVVRIYPFGAKKPTDCQLHWNDASQSQTG